MCTWVVQCVRMEEVARRRRGGCRQEQQGGRWKVLWGRKLKKQLKGKVEACVVPACVCGLETLALTERQEEKLRVAENNWVQRICKVKQEDQRKMRELRDETGIMKHLRMKVVGSRLRRAGHIERMSGEGVDKESLKNRRGW